MSNGIDFLTQLSLQKKTTAAYTLKLFTNNYTPSISSQLSNFTECTATGYSSIALTPANWQGSTTNGVSTYSYPQQTFTFNSGNSGVTVYGYYIVETNTNTVVWAEGFAQPYAIPSSGGQLLLNLTFTSNNC